MRIIKMTKQPSFFTLGGSVFYSLSNMNRNITPPNQIPVPIAESIIQAQTIKQPKHKK